ncbi:MAG: hypothetical protein OXI81_12645 [Paracoccaceae bacterium]|nr:hypothetical protein [Paracoccaceae bacterium]MDE2911467.1 hypothetical protein [Paracoccaceae bacterium]
MPEKLARMPVLPVQVVAGDQGVTIQDLLMAGAVQTTIVLKTTQSALHWFWPRRVGPESALRILRASCRNSN